MFKEWEEKAKKRSRQIRDRVVESSYKMAAYKVESVECMSPVPGEEVPKRKSQKFLAPMHSWIRCVMNMFCGHGRGAKWEEHSPGRKRRTQSVSEIDE